MIFHHIPKRSLSQNFLNDPNIVNKIISIAKIRPGETVLEIGPGTGVLTRSLLKSNARVIAVEKDSQLARALSGENLTVFESDFIDFSLRDIAAYAPMKIVANLPYQLTSPILGKLCEHSSLFSSAFLMIQREVAQRVVAKPGSSHMSPLTILLQIYSDPSLTIKWISRNCFFPVPNVDSSVVALRFRTPRVSKPQQLMNQVRRAFQQRRKMLRSSLGIQDRPYATLRPQDLSLEDWIKLCNEKAQSYF
jgi:16S rRNA (adenine1518-N6/adenine1519-N6)-dimethyltransferase